MGRIIDKQVIGFRCELRSCTNTWPIFPTPIPGHWSGHIRELHLLVEAGWAVVTNSPIRTYCPEHASQVFECTCRTHPERRHLCVEHDEDAAANIWVSADTPKEVADYLAQIGAIS